MVELKVGDYAWWNYSIDNKLLVRIAPRGIFAGVNNDSAVVLRLKSLPDGVTRLRYHWQNGHIVSDGLYACVWNPYKAVTPVSPIDVLVLADKGLIPF